MVSPGGAPPPATVDPYTAAAPQLGEACAKLLIAEAQWVHRRTETIDVLSSEHVRRSVAVDLTVPKPFQPLLTLSDDYGCLVPIATLRKRPLRNFDLRDAAGKAVPAVSKAQNAEIATQALVYRASRALASAGLSAPSTRLLADLRTIASEDEAQANSALTCLLQAAESGDAEAGAVTSDPHAGFMLADLAANYVLMAVVDSLAGRRVLKFGYDTAPDLSIGASTGLGRIYADIDAPGAGRAASYHAEVAVPEELRIFGAVLYDDDEQKVFYDFDANVDRAALYSADVPVDAHPSIFIAIQPERTGFPSVAAAVSVISAAFLVVGALFADLDPKLAGPPISILFAASALFSGAVVRAGEHRLVQGLFARPRQLLVLSALCSLGAAGVLAFDACPEAVRWTWRGTAAASTLISVLLSIVYLRSAPLRRGTRQD